MATTELTGKIALAAKREIPTTWAALRESKEFGSVGLQEVVDDIKMALFNEVISDTVESALDRRVIKYAGLLVAIDLIGPGIDYWAKQPTQLGATGRNETKSWSDRAEHLEKMGAGLKARAATMLPEVQSLLPNRRGPKATITHVQDGTGMTPNPFDLEPPYQS